MKTFILFSVCLALLIGSIQTWRYHTLSVHEAALRVELSAWEQTAEATPSVSEESERSGKAVESPEEAVSRMASMVARANEGDKEASLQILELMTKASTASEAWLHDFATRMSALEMPDHQREEMLMILIMMVSSHQPEVALSLLSPRFKEAPKTWMDAVRGTLENLAESDPAAARAWLGAHRSDFPDGDRDAEMIERAIEDKFRTQMTPEALAKEMATLTPTEAIATAGSLGGDLKSGAQVRGWLYGLGETLASQVEDFGGIVITSMPRLPFEELKTAVETASLSPEHRVASAAAVVLTEIGVRTAERADWFLSNAQATNRDEMLQTIVKRWTDADYNGAAAWLRDLEPGGDRDIATTAFAARITMKEPASAVDWAQTISNPQQQQRLLDRIFKQWAIFAPEEAKDYFIEKNLTFPNQ
ncbi:MAG: hypothetical protein KDN22_13790 [Verrucomicrobiae bacterium]|nr:hypothetical protein [Verrucomicrobiae bacterium]